MGRWEKNIAIDFKEIFVNMKNYVNSAENTYYGELLWMWHWTSGFHKSRTQFFFSFCCSITSVGNVIYLLATVIMKEVSDGFDLRRRDMIPLATYVILLMDRILSFDAIGIDTWFSYSRIHNASNYAQRLEYSIWPYEWFRFQELLTLPQGFWFSEILLI